MAARERSLEAPRRPHRATHVQVTEAHVLPDDRKLRQGALKAAITVEARRFLLDELTAHAALVDLRSVPAVLAWSADAEDTTVTSILFERLPRTLAQDIAKRAKDLAARRPADPRPSPGCPLYTPEEYWPIIVDVANVLDAAHKRGLLHGDVKPDNILMDARGKAMLGDWGLSHAYPKPGDRTPVCMDGPRGTHGYCLEELSSGSKGVPVHHSMDTQPLAITAMAMLYNMAPGETRQLHRENKLADWLQSDLVLRTLVNSTLNETRDWRVPAADWHRRCPVEYLVPQPAISAIPPGATRSLASCLHATQCCRLTTRSGERGSA